mmetsp:Transcript_6594/g.7175  ORF Transcript_6594/g.7175 Transcript_6594/m.7175 type:complete len:292 (+) Transcript_6594:87-962(+)
MGCCASKIPTFPSPSTGSHMLPSLIPDGWEGILHIPQTGITASSVGVFMPSDGETPSHFFAPAVGSAYHLYKIVADPVTGESTKEIAASIRQGWQSSQGYGYGQSDFSANNTVGSVTTSAKKTMTVVTSQNGIESKVAVHKKFQRNGDENRVEIDNGFSLNDNISERCEELRRDGIVVGKVFEKNLMAMGQMQMHRSSPMDMMKALQSPAAILLSSNLSANEKIQIITIIATASDRLIRSAQLDINSGGSGNHHDPYNNHAMFGNSHDDYDDNGGGGDGGGDDGGGGGGGE